MTDVPNHSDGGRRSRIRLLLSGVAALALATTAALMPGVAHADTTITTNQTGSSNGYFFLFWKDAPGTATLTLGPGGQFSTQWNGINSFVAGKGWRTGGRKTVAYNGSFSTTGNAYLGLTGWTTNPLVEYFIIDNWGSWRPSGTLLGTVLTDGGVYEIFRTLRVNHLTIQGIATHYQYWSVRTSKRASGAITTGNHFDAWARLGMHLGTHNYLVFAVTAYQCSGRADFTISQVAP